MFRPFKRNSQNDPKPLNFISNLESNGDEEEVLSEEQMDDEEVAELQGMWNFILPNEQNQEVLPVATRSRNQLHPPQSNSKQKTSMPPPRDKVVGKKSSPKSTQTNPVHLDSSPSSKTLIVSNEMEYNIIDDMKNTRVNITFHELSKLKHQ